MADFPTIEKTIASKKYVFKSKPTAKEVLAIQNANPAGNMGELYKNLAKSLIVEPVLTDEMWDNLLSTEFYEIVDTLLEVTGIDKVLFRAVRNTK